MASQGLTASYYHGTEWVGQPFRVRTEKNLDFDGKMAVRLPSRLALNGRGYYLRAHMVIIKSLRVLRLPWS